MSRLRAWVFAIIYGMAASVAAAADRPSPVDRIVQEVITLTAADGAEVPAVLMYPKSGLDPRARAIVFQHGGPGGHPIRSLGAPRWAAERLAARGYVTLSIMARHADQFGNTPFDESVKNVKAAVEWLDQLGATDIILAGHSFGSITITRYMVLHQDARVKAMVHYAPTRDTGQWMRANMGDERYKAVVDRFMTLISEGKGDTWTYEPFEVSPPAAPGLRSGYIQTAAAWLDHWGPAAQLRNTVGFRALKVPQLLLSGDKDTFVTIPFLDELKAAAVNAPRVDVKWYEGGINHVFEGVRDTASDDTFAFLSDLGLAPTPRVISRLVDITAADGAEQPGVLYEPAAGRDTSKPLFIVIYGYGGDVIRSSSEWLPARLAREGYTSLGVADRANGAAILRSIFTEVAKDHAAWVDYAASLGFSKVVLVGHSWGGIRATHYKVSTNDPRVAGLVFLAPTRDAPQWAERGLGREQYRRMVAEAKDAVAAGRGRTTLITGEGVMPPPAPPGMARP
ncbi:MAG: hypothetical protein SFV21_05605 [Rhodospirillaceae bacterium]|nr:hypothetical protein [Rhodospirillaceae bacterium]